MLDIQIISFHFAAAPPLSASSEPNNVFLCGDSTPLKIGNMGSGDVVSPNYPNRYPQDADCSRHVYVNESDFVRISFLDVSLGSG